MIHMGQTESPLPDILAVLKPGDIVTHMYAPPPNGIFDDAGKLLPAVADARKRGIWFDFGNGRVDHFTWDIVEHAMKERVYPDTISTDWGQAARTDQVFNFAQRAVEVPDASACRSTASIACVTSTAAKTFPAFKGLGDARRRCARRCRDLELRQGSFEFEDNQHHARTGTQKLTTRQVIKEGKVVDRIK